MPYYEPETHDHAHDVQDPEHTGGIVGFAAIKYTAIVVIVLAILGFLALYVLPRIG
jgi:hypothetical protein